jgi:hypothetical protein
MALKTPFILVICFIYNLTVVTTITFYTVTYLHSLQSLHANILILFEASGIHLENFENCCLSQSQSHIATDGHSVCLGVEPHLGLMTR